MRMQKTEKRYENDDNNIKYLICAMYHRRKKIFKCSARTGTNEGGMMKTGKNNV